MDLDNTYTRYSDLDFGDIPNFRQGLPGLLPDAEIRRLCLDTDRPMISPFNEKLKEKGVISHGLSSYGYDGTLAPKVKIAKTLEVMKDQYRFHHRRGKAGYEKTVYEAIDDGYFVLDPKNPEDRFFDEVEGDSFVLPPHGFALGYTNEYFDIPQDILSLCLGKSTYARSGIHVLVTPMEPGWSGNLVVEITGNSSLPTRIYTGEGICQFLFFKGQYPCEVPYDVRGGKYMNQTGITMGKIAT